jgi:hypothetical protein
VGFDVVLVIPIHQGGGDGAYLLSRFLLFRIRYVRYLMVFWCILFMRVLMLDFGKKLFSKFIYGVFMYSSSYSSCDGNEEVVEAPQKNLHRLSVT